MIRKILLLFFVAFGLATAFGQTCLQNGIELNSQAEVDSFPIKYPGCDSILGEVIISGSDIVNLDGLIQLTYIGGNLQIQSNPQLKDIAGLGGVIKINGSLAVASNDSLFSLTGLNNIEWINGDFAIKGNNELISLSSEVFALDSVKGVLQIAQNGKLQDISSLIGTTYVNSLEISNNRALTALNGLESINYLPGHLDIGNNNALTGLSGLENLDSIQEYLSIYGNKLLENLDGLVSLKKVGFNFNLFFNDELKNITGLKNLNHLSGLISISGNNKLESLEGLDSLDIDLINYIEIFFNRELEICNTPSICEYISECKEANIYKNAGTCEYLSDVQLACGLDSTSYTVTESACDSFVYKGEVYFDSGIYIQKLPDTSGFCDTTVILFLTIPKSDLIDIKQSACDSFIFGLDTLYFSGQFTYFGTNSSGCDSIVNLDLRIYHPTADTIDVVACVAAEVNGFIYTESGSYVQDHLVNVGGCDSTLYVNVTINEGSPDYDTIYLEGCDIVTYNNSNFFEDTTWTEYFVNQQFCDSVVTTNIHIKLSSTSTINAVDCGFYVLNGEEYSESGTYEQFLTNAIGCDSIITLNLTILDGSKSFVSITLSECEQYIFAGDTLTASGTYVDSLTNRFGCDSIVTLNLTILEDKTETINVTTCEFYTINGQTFNVSGSYFQFLLTEEGCDSTLLINLTILPGNNTSASLTDTICDQVNINGIAYDESGVYTQELTSATGCDSTLTINLTVFNSFDTIINQKACESFTLNGEEYDESGIYQQHYTTINGCDSTYILNLILGYGTDTLLFATACDAFVLNNQSYTESGEYTQVIFNSTGCDSTIILSLTILDSSNMLTIFDVESCDPYTFNGITYDSTGRYVQHFTNSVGCDSSVQINLTILEATADTIISSACNAFFINDSTYEVSGAYIQYLTNDNGCDSLLYLFLTIYHPGSLTLNESTCDSFELNDFVYFESGTYTQFIEDDRGCDSIITINLNVLEVDTEITQVEDTLYASSQDNLEYQWIDCVTGELIDGAVNFSYHPGQNGSYACIINNGGCVDTTECVSFISSLAEVDKEDSWRVYPNPNNGQFEVQFNEVISNASLEIFDATGKKVQADVELHGSKMVVRANLISGLYTLWVTTAMESTSSKIIVLE